MMNSTIKDNLKEYTYRYRIYPNDEQKLQLNKTFGCCRYVFNYYLDRSNKKNYTSKMDNSECRQSRHFFF